MCAQIFSLVVASVGLAAFAIVLSLVEQLIIQARLRLKYSCMDQFHGR